MEVKKAWMFCSPQYEVKFNTQNGAISMFSVDQQDTTFIKKKNVLNHIRSLKWLLFLLCNLSDQKITF
jgi:hypothetical protein